MFTKKIVTVALVSSLAGFTLAAQAAGDNGASVVLQGVITNTTCSLDVNGVNGGTTVDTKDHPIENFSANANNLTGNLFPMKVTLKGCLPGAAEEDLAGNLIVLGNVAANGNNNIFVGNSTDTGFMVLKSGGTTSADAVANNMGVPVTILKSNTNTDYTFQVAMASTVATPAVGAYTAPITVSFAAE